MARSRRRDGAANPLGLLLAIIGATTMAISTFLPLTEPVEVFGTVRSNTLIQHGGWWLIAAALGIAVSAYWVSRRNAHAWMLPVLGSIGAGAWVVYLAVGKSYRTVYRVDATGMPDVTQPGVVAPFGIALYVAGAGAAIALIGSFITRFGALRVFDLLLAGSERHPGY
jgi:hypothetical protein